MAFLDYWWVTRPKRRLNAIPEELAAFASVALNQPWRGNRELHLAFEEALEDSAIKRVGERRDQSGSGGRTHAAWLASLGLWFEKDNSVFLTLAGESLLEGKSAFQILKKQALCYQFPSAYSASLPRPVSPRFKIRPLLFLLRLLADNRLGYLTQDEIACIVIFEAENESDQCYERIVERILRFRNDGEKIFSDDFLHLVKSSPKFQNIANTLVNWLDYTRLVYRDKTLGSSSSSKGSMRIAPENITEVKSILSKPPRFIVNYEESVNFQRKYGVDPWHLKDTRNLLRSGIVDSRTIEKNRVLKEFFKYASLHPVCNIDANVVNEICERASTNYAFTEKTLNEAYPHGAIGGFLTEYRDMAFQGRENAVNFEKATATIFQDVFGYKANHIGQSGSASTPDILVISDSDGYQAIVDCKAYTSYTISGDHRNRMIHNYLNGLANYSASTYPLAFFTYISGGFGSTFDRQLQDVVAESEIPGSGISVANFISLVEKRQQTAYSHGTLRSLFSLGRQIVQTDF